MIFMEILLCYDRSLQRGKEPWKNFTVLDLTKPMIPDISYLILNYNPEGEENARRILGETIDAFYARKSKRLRCEVFLLDQGSPDFHRRWILEQQDRYGFSSVFLSQNIGISGAINWLARTAKAPVIGLVTSDVIITTGMDEDLFQKVQIGEVFQATPFTDKSDVGYQIWIPGEDFGSSDVDLTALANREDSWVENLVNGRNRGYIRAIGVELNVMFWRKDVFQRIGYFDERWKACYENNDFSLRCFLAGGCTAVSKGSFVWHVHKVTEKNGSRDRCFREFGSAWPQKLRQMWDEKWPNLENLINLYKPLKEKTISDYPRLRETFQHNIRLPFSTVG